MKDRTLVRVSSFKAQTNDDCAHFHATERARERARLIDQSIDACEFLSLWEQKGSSLLYAWVLLCSSDGQE